MLVISRKQQEVIQIGEDILVKIIKTGRGAVKIGIDAPGGVRVLRGELDEESLLRSAPNQRPAESLHWEPQATLA